MAEEKKGIKAEEGVLIPPPQEEHRVIVCFKPDAGIRYTGLEITSITGVNISKLKKCLTKYGAVVNRLFSQTEETLEREVTTLAKVTGETLPDLSRYYLITTPTTKDAEALSKELEKEELVDSVYIEPPTYLALFDEMPSPLSEEAPPSSPDFSSLQGYLDPAPGGIDAKYAHRIRGGKGAGIRIIDIEGAWNFSHEDLRQNQGGVVCNTPTSDLRWENHGTAVIGEISGDENRFGIIGIAPQAMISASSIFPRGSANAIKCAADRLSRGDIILIELHRPGPRATGHGQQGFIPIEYWDADFAAIKYATAKGIIVVEAAGNGGENLDDPVYGRKFDRTFRDSGAILVGAGAPPSGHYGPDRSRLGFSNYGSIVDVQGWGREVTTTGYGDLQGGTDKNRWYTQRFSGTSPASPIVVGAVACLQGIRKATGQTPLTNLEIRDIFRTTGSPQVDAPGRPATQRIGNRPDLKAAINRVIICCRRYLYYLRRVVVAARQNPRLRSCLLYYVCACRIGGRPRCTRAQIAVVRRVISILRRCPQYRGPFCRAIR